MGKMTVTPGKDKGAFDRAMAQLPKIQTKVGWFESAKYDDAEGTPVAYIAAIQDQGVASQSIPARPFFEPTKTREKYAWGKLMEQLSKRVLAGRMSAYQAMEALGLQASADTQKTITLITEPPLSILTLMARQRRKEGGKVTGATIGEFAAEVKKNGPPDLTGVSDKPLEETGRMLATLVSVTEEKGS